MPRLFAPCILVVFSFVSVAVSRAQTTPASASTTAAPKPASTPSAAAAENASPYTLLVATDHEDAIYKQGEPVTFTIKLLHDKQPEENAEVCWTLSKDGTLPKKAGKVALVHGIGTVSGQLDEPGFLQCRVVFPTSPKSSITTVAGAAIDPLKIQPSAPVPEDFDAFWAAQKQKLAAVPINARLTPLPSPLKNMEAFDLQADCVGAPVSGYYVHPVGAKPKSLPALLSVQGAGVHSSNMGSAKFYANRGMISMDINAHGLPNGKPEEFYKDLFAGEFKEYWFRGRESRETCYFLGMYLRLVRAIDFLTSQPEWDGRNVTVVGTSQGRQALVAAGLDPRVTFFAAGVPACCDHTGFLAGRISGWPKLVPMGPDGKPDPAVAQAARYFDAVNFVRRTKASGIIAVGFVDTTCPPTSVYAAYNALATPKEIINQPLASHEVTPASYEKMRQAIQARIDAVNSRN